MVTGKIARRPDRRRTDCPLEYVEVNRAVAVVIARGVSEDLQLLSRLESQAEDFYPYHAARTDLLRRTNRREAADGAHRRALDRWGKPSERWYFHRRPDWIEPLAN